MKNNYVFKYIRVECPEPVEGQYWIYILECNDGSLYCGSTNDLKDRLNRHNAGEGAEWTKKRLPVVLVYFEKYDTLISAQRQEKQIKGWAVIKKENLISGKWHKITPR